jgi:RNA polymerase sigma factor (sigma-70 family)
MPHDELIRYLHATYAAPNDAVTDGELLRRCGTSRDDAAFELLMRRHAGLVWKVCQAVVRNHHDAEDAFQATFLALARKVNTIGYGTVAGWLCRVAYHAALKARLRPVANLIDGASSPLDEATERTEVAQVLHEELDRLAECYRAPLILCYLEDFTHAEAARHLGWPVGTVATRVARGRDRLRNRLIRRGIVLPSGGLFAAFNAGPASALAPSLITATVQAIATGTGLSKSVHYLAQGALSVMTRTKIWYAAVIVTLAASVVLAFAVSADPPAPQTPTTKEKTEEKEKEKKPVEGSLPINPGIQALVAASTDVIIADVVDTNPNRAMEGARDTVKLKVVRTLLGRPTAGETIGVYYHLLWSDEKREDGGNLESPKFTKGKRYVIFLNSQLSGRPDGDRIEYQLTDRWLSVLPDHVDLVKEVAAAVRVSHGDSRGEWSSADGSIAGLQGRLAAYRGESANGDTPIITVYLDLRNTAGGNNTTEFRLDGAKANWTVFDAGGKASAPTSPPANKIGSDKPRKLILAAKESGRLPLTISGAALAPGGAGHLELGWIDQVWEFANGDKGQYFLAGKIAIAPTGQPGQWFGTLNLPKVRIPLKE